ncbi:MAG TPA: response regulator [Bacteroidota bacterium]|nr:response regulator [Bacteroidota bacterium]
MIKSIRILYVDDEQNLRQLIKEQLMGEGYNVDTADDGDTASEKLKSEKYDLVLLDIRMPRMNGIEVLKFIKSKKLSCRIIMLTAVDDLAIAMEAVKQGANDYLTKPYELETLLKSIRRVMNVA